MRRSGWSAAVGAMIMLGLGGCPGSIDPGDELDEDAPGLNETVINLGDDTVPGEGLAEGTRTVAANGAAQVLYLNFDGVTLSPGSDNATTNTSSIVKASSSLPKFNHKRFKMQNFFQSRSSAIKKIVDKVKGYYDKLNVKVVTTRPSSGAYTMIVIGGKPGDVQYTNKAAGRAPVDCGNTNPNNIGFVFSDGISSWIGFPKTMVALTIAHEAGHTFGLNHISSKTAIMAPTAVDALLPLAGWKSGGITGTKHCATSSGSSQDSRKELLANLGQPGSAPQPAPGPSPQPAPQPPGGSCHPGQPFGTDYCSSGCPCAEGQGDCDGDSECKPGLVCAKDVGANYGQPAWVDLCQKKGSAPAPAPGPSAPGPSQGCHQGQIFGLTYCSPGCPCSGGEGDCDSDADCKPGLVCVMDLGAAVGQPSYVDICDAPGKPAGPTCPPPGTSFNLPPKLGDLDGQPCDYGCWGKGSLYNQCGSNKWQFCGPHGAFYPCQTRP
jgi:hypothetical protein